MCTATPASLRSSKRALLPCILPVMIIVDPAIRFTCVNIFIFTTILLGTIVLATLKGAAVFLEITPTIPFKACATGHVTCLMPIFVATGHLGT